MTDRCFGFGDFRQSQKTTGYSHYYLVKVLHTSFLTIFAFSVFSQVMHSRDHHAIEIHHPNTLGRHPSFLALIRSRNNSTSMGSQNL